MKRAASKLTQPIMILGLGFLKYPSSRASMPHRAINVLSHKYQQELHRISPNTLTAFYQEENILLVKQDDYSVEKDLRQIMYLYDIKDLKTSIFIYRENSIPPFDVFAAKHGKVNSYDPLNRIVQEFNTEDFYRIGIGIDKPENLGLLYGDDISGDPRVLEQRFLLARLRTSQQNYFENNTMPVVSRQIDVNIAEIIHAAKKVDIEKPSTPITPQTPPIHQVVFNNIHTNTNTSTNTNTTNSTGTPLPSPLIKPIDNNQDRNERYDNIYSTKQATSESIQTNRFTKREESQSHTPREPLKKEENAPKKEPSVAGGRFGRGRLNNRQVK
eukprot:TRINITY_DN1010_c0_g1_i1.p1 TRINITY_DN1010_c0_g1~~TRINITY_DN1010_c0_g1_i1.p1  ORF type:complete len:328 (+),score=62.04 TRINITY_DN1010_c0_g1_i1:163-1146(+)